MSREIKFRAWDIHKNIYVDIEDVTFSKNGEQTIIKVFPVNEDYLNESFDPTQFIVEQYTGLKDKNGKEIYEGDFEEGLGVVIWSEVYAGWFIKLFKPYEGRIDPLFDHTPFEVSGNIHQHKHLLQ